MDAVGRDAHRRNRRGRRAARSRRSSASSAGSCFALSTALYLSYSIAGQVFLGFQWDNLLLECGLLAVVLPRTRAAPVAHFLFRALLFKLYFESASPSSSRRSETGATAAP